MIITQQHTYLYGMARPCACCNFSFHTRTRFYIFNQGLIDIMSYICFQYIEPSPMLGMDDLLRQVHNVKGVVIEIMYRAFSTKVAIFVFWQSNWRTPSGRLDSFISNGHCDLAVQNTHSNLSLSSNWIQKVHLYNKSCTNWGGFFLYKNQQYPFFSNSLRHKRDYEEWHRLFENKRYC